MHANFEIKKRNTLKVFNALRKKGSLSRKEIASITSLSWGSVSAITSDLLSRGVLIVENIFSEGGRPAEKLTLNPSRFLQLGIDVNSIGLRFVVVSLGGSVIYSDFLPIISNEKDDLLRALENKTQEILTLYPAVCGISVSMQGKINRKTGVSLRTNFFKDWKEVPLVEFFNTRFSLPTKLYHDPDCLMAYHLFTDRRLENASDGFVVRVDDGIGMARLIDGKIYQIGDDTSFELGHTIAVPNGKFCPCGKKGCLERYSSLRGIKDAYLESKGKSAENFFSLLKSRDKSVEEFVRTANEHLGIALANLFTLSCPEFIMLDGLYFVQAPYAFELIKCNTDSVLNGNSNLLLALYKAEAPAIGACLLTIEEIAEKVLF